MTSIRDFGAVGDGRTDDTAAIEHALHNGEGSLVFPRGEYRITRTITIDLPYCSIDFDNTADVIVLPAPVATS